MYYNAATFCWGGGYFCDLQKQHPMHQYIHWFDVIYIWTLWKIAPLLWNRSCYVMDEHFWWQVKNASHADHFTPSLVGNDFRWNDINRRLKFLVHFDSILCTKDESKTKVCLFSSRYCILHHFLSNRNLHSIV